MAYSGALGATCASTSEDYRYPGMDYRYPYGPMLAVRGRWERSRSLVGSTVIQQKMVTADFLHGCKIYRVLVDQCHECCLVFCCAAWCPTVRRAARLYGVL